jgi:peptide subunit release factor 1 (eRF1)
LRVLEEHNRFAAVLIDKHRAKILVVDAMGMEQIADFIAEVPGKHASTGTDHIWSQSQMARDHLMHLKAHAGRVALELAAHVDRSRIDSIVVGGPVEATSVFIGELPRRLQQMVIDTISVSLDGNYDRLLSDLKAVKESAERDEESKLVQSLITSAHKGDRAVLGPADTFEAILEGRVYCMIIARDFRISGVECRNCRALWLQAEGNCPVCGGELDQAPDLVSRASRRVLEQAGKVRLVSGEAAARLGGAGLGAVLRF